MRIEIDETPTRFTLQEFAEKYALTLSFRHTDGVGPAGWVAEFKGCFLRNKHEGAWEATVCAIGPTTRNAVENLVGIMQSNLYLLMPGTQESTPQPVSLKGLVALDDVQWEHILSFNERLDVLWGLETKKYARIKEKKKVSWS